MFQHLLAFISENLRESRWIFSHFRFELAYKIAEKYFKANGLRSTFVITYQVINEVSNILLKNGYTETKIRENIDHMFRLSTIQDFTKEIILTASSARENYSFSFWDSILVGSALFSEYNMLISEDMQDDLMVNNKLLIKNIFV